jgi:hypothetical protein
MFHSGVKREKKVFEIAAIFSRECYYNNVYPYS